MNTGIQDGYNLAWKLAHVLRGRADAKILDSYNEERLENAKNLLRTTDRMFQVAAGDQWWLAFLRTTVMPSIANYILNLDWVRHFVFPTLSQIGINYRHSSLSRHAGDEDFTVKAGDRLPYLDGGRVYDHLKAPKFHLLAFGNSANMEMKSAGLVDCHAFDLSEEVKETFGTDEPFTVLLRPDNYIGFIVKKTSETEVESYMRSM